MPAGADKRRSPHTDWSSNLSDMIFFVVLFVVVNAVCVVAASVIMKLLGCSEASIKACQRAIGWLLFLAPVLLFAFLAVKFS